MLSLDVTRKGTLTTANQQTKVSYNSQSTNKGFLQQPINKQRLLTTANQQTKASYNSQSTNKGFLQQPIACYKIAKRTYDFVMTYVGNRTINMTFVILFLVVNNTRYYTILIMLHHIVEDICDDIHYMIYVTTLHDIKYTQHYTT